jgi:hypothetical protein
MKPMVARKTLAAALTFKVELDILKELAAEEPKPEPAPDDSETGAGRIFVASEVSG